MNVLSRYASLVQFAHTVFALPFAMCGYFLAVDGYGFEWRTLILMLLCMVFARNAAMGFNRWADRRIDASNPRTANREIPSGKISPRAAAWFVAGNAAGFVVAAGLLNGLALVLSPAALAVILGYSYTKRFTWASHLVLGLALAIAPTGAYIAVAGRMDFVPLLLSFLVLTWVGGFDIIYSLQDAAFDKANKLHSIPARFSVEQSLGISIGLHMASLSAVTAVGLWTRMGALYWTGGALFAAILAVQHAVVTPSHIDRAGRNFTLINGVSGFVFALFYILDLYL